MSVTSCFQESKGSLDLSVQTVTSSVSESMKISRTNITATLNNSVMHSDNIC